MLGMRVQVLGTSMMRFFSMNYGATEIALCIELTPLSQSWTVGGNTISCEKLDVITSTEC